MIASVANLGVQSHYDAERAQRVRLTNSFIFTISMLYFFYIIYGIGIGCGNTVIFSAAFMLLSFGAFVISAKGRTGLSKVIIISITSFSVLFTYHSYNINLAVLTSYFPILMTFVFFFDFEKEKKYFWAALSFTAFTIILCAVIPRHSFLKLELLPEVARLSNQLHIVVSFVITGVLLLIVIKNKNRVNKELVNQKNNAEKTLEKLRQTQSQLIQSEKMASLGMLTAGINHEINNPLNFIMGGLENLKHELNGRADDVQPYLFVLDEGVNRISKIVSSLNHFSYQSERSDVACDLNSILSNCLNILAHKFKDQIKLIRYFGEDVVMEGNSGQLHQVFLNVIANALQSLDNSGTITLTTSAQSGYCTVEICDDGSGMSASTQKRIFDPFFTTKKPGQGTGLGLSISQKIISDHGGHIEVESEPGKGSKFTILIPQTVKKPVTERQAT